MTRPFACSPEARCTALLAGRAVGPRCRRCDGLQQVADTQGLSLPRHRWPGYGDPGSAARRTTAWLIGRAPRLDSEREEMTEWLRELAHMVRQGMIVPERALWAVAFVASRRVDRRGSAEVLCSECLERFEVHVGAGDPEG